MKAKIIDGKLMAEKIRHEVALRVEHFSNLGWNPGLAVILVGENTASMSYVTAKERDCEIVGIKSFDIRLPEKISQQDLISEIQVLNCSREVSGILVQLPLPEHIDSEAVIKSINVDKDVDGFHPQSMGKLILNLPGFVPCTPLGIIKMLEHASIPTRGADVVIVGRSRIVGAPLATLMMRNAAGGNATVTVCHSQTRNIQEKTRHADILIVATGKPELIKANMVKDGAVVIDVGINRIESQSRPKGYKIVGDVDFESVSEVAGAISPVPGGVGPMTRAMLLCNTIEALEKEINTCQ